MMYTQSQSAAAAVAVAVAVAVAAAVAAAAAVNPACRSSHNSFLSFPRNCRVAVAQLYSPR